MTLPAITRPNGKTYRPRKVKAFICGEDFQTCLVLGTHDVERARRLAQELMDSIDPGYSPGLPFTGWWRDGFSWGERAFIEDEARGRAGVSFEAFG